MTTIFYQLWDLDTGNCLGGYPSESAALADVRAGVREDGAAAWSAIGLLRVGEQPEDTRRVAAGDDLIKRAMEAREPAA